MEIEVTDINVECPKCKHKFTTEATVDIDPPERDEL